MSKASRAWDVYLDGKHIDTVHFIYEMGADEVNRALVGHDNFHPNIVVTEVSDFAKFQKMLASFDPNCLDLVADENEVYSPFGTSNS